MSLSLALRKRPAAQNPTKAKVKPVLTTGALQALSPNLNIQPADIDRLVEKYALGQRAECLEKVFERLDLSVYFQYAVRYANANADYYLDSGRTPAYWFNVTLNAYEGSMWEQLTVEETMLLVIACLFSCMRDPKKEVAAADALAGLRLSGTMRMRIHSIIRCMYDYSAPSKNKEHLPVAAIARDASMMAVYQNDSLVTQHFTGVYYTIQELRRATNTKPMKSDFFLSEQVRIQRAYFWLTRWAKKKAFTLNYPAHVERMRTLMAHACMVDELLKEMQNE